MDEVEKFIKQLKEYGPSKRAKAAERLGLLEDARAVPVLISALKDRHWYVQVAAASALGKIRDAAAVPALMDSLKDKDSDVESAAADALVQIGAPAVPALIEALLDIRAGVRGVAGRALRGMAARTLDLIGLENVDAECRVLCLCLLSKAAEIVAMGEEAVPGLICALRYIDVDVKNWAASALVDIGTSAVPALIDALGDRDCAVRERAAWALGEINDGRAVPALIGALKDESWEVRHMAIGKLIKLASVADIDDLSALSGALRDHAERMKKTDEDRYLVVRGWALDAYLKISKAAAEARKAKMPEEGILSEGKIKAPRKPGIYRQRRVTNG